MFLFPVRYYPCEGPNPDRPVKLYGMSMYVDVSCETKRSENPVNPLPHSGLSNTYIQVSDPTQGQAPRILSDSPLGSEGLVV